MEFRCANGARKTAVNEKAYCYWQRRVYEAAKATMEPVFAEVVTPEAYGGGIAAVVHSSSVRVEIMNGADAATVQTIINALSTDARNQRISSPSRNRSKFF